MRENMVSIPGGMMLMNTGETPVEQTPAHQVSVNPFWMDRHAISNRQFKQFIHDTGYVTRAERVPAPALESRARPELELTSTVASHSASESDRGKWWTFVPGANWKHPRGPGSSLNGLWNHPVVHVAFEDAQAYADWARKELPTEAEWEFAARGGHEGVEFIWGQQYMHTRRALSNNWPGEFSWNQLLADYDSTAPLGSYLPNGYGLFDMAGNVWEWTVACAQQRAGRDDARSADAKSCGCASEHRVSLRAHVTGIPRKVMNRVSHRYVPDQSSHRSRSAAQTEEVDIFNLGFRCIVRASTL